MRQRSWLEVMHCVQDDSNFLFKFLFYSPFNFRKFNKMLYKTAAYLLQVDDRWERLVL